MRSGLMRPPGATFLMLLGSASAASPDIVRQTSGEVTGIGGAPEGYGGGGGGAQGGYGA